MNRCRAVLAVLLALAACAQAPARTVMTGEAVEAKPGEAIVVLAFDLLSGAPGLEVAAGPEPGTFRAAFFAYDPTTQRFYDPPRGFVVEQECGEARPGQRACGHSAKPVAVALVPGDYMLVYIVKGYKGFSKPGVWAAGGAYTTLAAPLVTTPIKGVIKGWVGDPAVPVTGNPAPRFTVAAGETVYVGDLLVVGAQWLRPFDFTGYRADWGRATLDIAVESNPTGARDALARAGLPSDTMIERLAAPPAP